MRKSLKPCSSTAWHTRRKTYRRFRRYSRQKLPGSAAGPTSVITDHKALIRQITRDMGQATIHAVDFSDRKIFGDGRVAWASSKSTITFTVDGKTKADHPRQVDHGAAEHREPLAHRAAPLLHALWGTVGRAVVSRGHNPLLFCKTGTCRASGIQTPGLNGTRFCRVNGDPGIKLSPG